MTLDHHPFIEAVLAGRGGLFPLIGVPGAGKTHCLVDLIRAITQKQGRTRSLFLGFARKTRDEFVERVGAAVGLQAETIHSFGYSLLVELAGRRISLNCFPDLGYTKPVVVPASFQLLSKDEQIIEVFRKVATAVGFQPNGQGLSDYQIRAAYSYYCQSLQRGEWNGDVSEAKTYCRFVKLYAAEKQRRGYIDFFDMLLLPLALLKADSSYRRQVRSRYHFIVADEVQDLSHHAWDLVQTLKGRNTTLVLAGDINQRIYPFLGVPKNIFKSAQQRFPKSSVQPHVLAVNKRSTQAIARFVAALTAEFVDRAEFDLLPDPTKPKGTKPLLVVGRTPASAQAYIAEEIQRLVRSGYCYGDIVLLFRAPNAQFSRGEIDGLAKALKAFEVPFVHRREESEQQDRIGVGVDSKQAAQDADSVRLLSVHGFKGGEAKVVFLVGVDKFRFPLSFNQFVADLEEERSVFFVGSSRGKERLYLLHHRCGGESWALSPFLKTAVESGHVDWYEAPRARNARGSRRTLTRERPLIGEDLL